VKAIGIRELKNKLSRCLEEVRRGEVFLVTDRGVVVAELRRPAEPAADLTPLERRMELYIREGIITRPTPRDERIYRRPSFSVTTQVADDALAWVRGER